MAVFGRKQQDTNAPASPFLQAFRTADGGMTVRLDPGQIGSPGVAGIMVVDIMRHMSRALTQFGAARSEDDAMAVMLQLIRAEIDRPTDLGTGSIVN